MRTKTLLVAGAISALALTASLAQSVYSVNVVGYVNVPVVQGFNLVANPLDASPDNAIPNVIPNAPNNGDYILKWNPSIQNFEQPQTFYQGAGWFDPDFNATTLTVQPSEGFFYNAVSSSNITFVGDVRQGPLSASMVVGFNLMSQLTPQSGNIMNFNFPAGNGDYILFWDASIQNFRQPVTFYEGAGWYDPDFNAVDPVANVGQGFFMNRVAAGTWTYTFSVQ